MSAPCLACPIVGVVIQSKAHDCSVSTNQSPSPVGGLLGRTPHHEFEASERHPLPDSDVGRDRSPLSLMKDHDFFLAIQCDVL